MTLYLIGLGLCDERDISLKGLEIVKRCDKVYLEGYTSKLQCSVKDLEKLYGKKVVLATRKIVEEGMDKILENARNKDIALLIIGSVFAATTHINYLLECKNKGINVEVIENASIFTAVGITGLSLYNFGKVTSIPLNYEDIETPIKVINENLKENMHTLVLLDIQEDKLMSIREALHYLKSKGLGEKQLVIGCAGLGSSGFQVKAGPIKDIMGFNFKVYPQCLVIPAKKLHFMEEEGIRLWY